MKTQKVWMNIYVAGMYHRMGKPDCCDLHGGDFYKTRESALSNAALNSVCTTEVEISIPDDMELCFNLPDSVPIPLSVTRKGS